MLDTQYIGQNDGLRSNYTFFTIRTIILYRDLCGSDPVKVCPSPVKAHVNYRQKQGKKASYYGMYGFYRPKKQPLQTVIPIEFIVLWKINLSVQLGTTNARQ
jgi:hypothetical protein